MIRQQLQKSGDDLIVTIPRDKVERWGLKEGHEVGLLLHPDIEGADPDPRIRAIIAKSFEECPETYLLHFEEDLEKIR